MFFIYFTILSSSFLIRITGKDLLKSNILKKILLDNKKKDVGPMNRQF